MEVWMKKGKRVWFIGGGVVLLAVIIIVSINSSHKNTVAVQTSKVQRKSVLISKVTASGQIRAKKSVDLQSEVQGIITDLPVHEGDSVKKGQVLLRIDPVQTNADLEASRAANEQASAQTRMQEFDISNSEVQLMREEASLKSVRAQLQKEQDNYARTQSSFKRQQQLHEDGLISRDDYEEAQNRLKAAKATLEMQQSSVTQAEEQIRVAKNNIAKMKNQLAASQASLKQSAASLSKQKDQSSKTIVLSPQDGVITQLKKEKGERAVPGMMTSPEATIMTIADLSIIQAELKVDETDIVNLSIGDSASVKVDALPDVSFQGEVTEIGNSPISTSSSSQEAKDFKVIITLKDPSSKLRPGMSCTGDITTETRSNVLVIPIQALTVRDVEVDKNGMYHPPDLEKKNKGSVARADSGKEKEDIQKKELEGVFVINENKVARFRVIKTGITGESEIEVLGNLKEGEEIVSGSFQTLRTIKDGAAVKVERAVKSGSEKSATAAS
jgi:HlyD family secretion protein